MSQFLIFNDNCDTVLNIETIEYLWLDESTISIGLKTEKDNIELCYETNKKALKDYNILTELLKTKEIASFSNIQKPKKQSLKNEAMKEVNEFLGKSRSKKNIQILTEGE